MLPITAISRGECIQDAVGVKGMNHSERSASAKLRGRKRAHSGVVKQMNKNKFDFASGYIPLWHKTTV
jgi:hypothetical protein